MQKNYDTFESVTAGEQTIHRYSNLLSWGAITAGAVAATAITMVLTTFGSALGVSSASPYSYNHDLTLTAGAIIWIVIVQSLCSGFGGYLAGRFSNRSGKEDLFRDIVHGLLSWAVATIFVATLFASIMGTLELGGRNISETGMVMNQKHASAIGYRRTEEIVDDMIRPNGRVADTHSSFNVKRDIIRIIASRPDRNLTQADRDRLTQILVTQMGMSEDEAAARVGQGESKMRADLAEFVNAADDAGKDAARFSFVTGITMIMGAVIGSIAGAIGGRQRNNN